MGITLEDPTWRGHSSKKNGKCSLNLNVHIVHAYKVQHSIGNIVKNIVVTMSGAGAGGTTL